MERVEGQSLKKFVKHHTTKEVHNSLNHLAKTCAQLHELKINRIKGRIFSNPIDEYSYAKKFASLKDNLDYGKNWDYKWATDWLTVNAEKFPCEKYSLLHFDMALKNFIITKDMKIIFIDWEWAEFGDPLMDIASAYHEIRQVMGIKFASLFIKQYMNSSKREIDYSKLRFYIIASGLNLVLYYRFLSTKELATSRYLTKIYGKKLFPVFPLIRWYFTMRRKRLERYLRKELLNYEQVMFKTEGGKRLSSIEKENVLDFLNASSSDLILDVGTANGRIAREIILKTGARVIGIDVGRPLSQNESKKNEFIENYELVIADGQYLPFRKNVFDGVVCIRTFKYFPNYILGLSEMKRALVKSGRLIISLSSIFGYDIILRRVTHSLGARGHHVFNIYKTKNLLNQYGLSIVNSISLQKIPHPIWNLSDNLIILQILEIAERLLRIITPQFFARSVLLKCLKNHKKNYDN
jgi:thiamine kinase-like enzyme